MKLMLLMIAAMFGGSFLWVYILWRIEDKAIDKEIRRRYPDWRKK